LSEKNDSGLTYRDAGVDAERGDELIERIARFAKATHRPGLVSGIGGFASLFSLKDALGGAPLNDPLLVSGTDGVGTKLKVAFAANRHDTVGIDLVAMCMNDVLTCGAIPLFFLDYFGTGKLELGTAEAVIRGIAEGCRRAECSLVGGETAELPGFYEDGEYDLAGFAVGVVERSEVIDGKSVVPGDAILGIGSTGLHSNGYSLARRALFDRAGYRMDSMLDGLERPLGEVLLEPTAIYTSLIRALRGKVTIKALAHITGGGLEGNVPRVLPNGVVAALDAHNWPRPPIFAAIERAGNVARAEMYKTFNMGIGLVIVVSGDQRDAALTVLKDIGEKVYSLGEIKEGAPGAEAVAELTGI
jgi:phosphoribosylformylglycinamidine cyclo-ligase